MFSPPLGSIATIVVMFVWLKAQPFLSLMGGSAVMAQAAGVPYTEVSRSFSTGLGSSLGGVGGR